MFHPLIEVYVWRHSNTILNWELTVVLRAISKNKQEISSVVGSWSIAISILMVIFVTGECYIICELFGRQLIVNRYNVLLIFILADIIYK